MYHLDVVKNCAEAMESLTKRYYKEILQFNTRDITKRYFIWESLPNDLAMLLVILWLEWAFLGLAFLGLGFWLGPHLLQRLIRRTLNASTLVHFFYWLHLFDSHQKWTMNHVEIESRHSIFRKGNVVLGWLRCALINDSSRRRYLDSTTIFESYR